MLKIIEEELQKTIREIMKEEVKKVVRSEVEKVVTKGMFDKEMFGLPTRAGELWSTKEDNGLKKDIKKTISLLAKKHQRSENAITARIYRLCTEDTLFLQC